MATPQVYLNGRIIPLSEAAISPLDIGFLRGYAVFDLLRTAGGRPVLLAEHIERLRHSAEILGLTVPLSDEEIEALVDKLLELNGHAESTVRIVVSGGVSPDGMSFDGSNPTVLILVHELHEPPASLYEQGGALLLRKHVREMPEAKTTNYITMLQAKGETAEAGAMDLLYHDGERIYEAASASVYFVRDGRIHAPADRVLWGTVGSLVLELAQPEYEVVTGEIALEDALSADEVFLTSTTRGVVPIVRLDDAYVGEGLPGPVTRELMARWEQALGKR